MDQQSSLRRGEKAEKLSQEQLYKNQLFPGGFVTGQGLQPPPKDCPELPALFPCVQRCFIPLMGNLQSLIPAQISWASHGHKAHLPTGQQRFSPVTPGLWGRDEPLVSGQSRLQPQLPVQLWEKLCSKRTWEFNVNSLPHSNTSKPKLSQGASQQLLLQSS